MATQVADLLPGERADLIEEAREVLGDDADWWLESENRWLSLSKPRELIESGEPEKQQRVRTLLRQIKAGIFT
jgi:hypothetical protein